MSVYCKIENVLKYVIYCNLKELFEVVWKLMELLFVRGLKLVLLMSGIIIVGWYIGIRLGYVLEDVCYIFFVFIGDWMLI